MKSSPPARVTADPVPRSSVPVLISTLPVAEMPEKLLFVRDSSEKFNLTNGKDGEVNLAENAILILPAAPEEVAFGRVWGIDSRFGEFLQAGDVVIDGGIDGGETDGNIDAGDNAGTAMKGV